MKFNRSSLVLWLRIAGVCVILFGLRAWSEYYFDSKPPIIEADPTTHLPNGALPVLWTVPTFSSLDQNNRPTTEKDLGGHVCIIDFIFTTCTTACPMMTAKMLLLQKAVHNPDIRFVSFSVDPGHDTPAILKQYAATWKGDESRWLLLHTDQQTLHQTAVGMKVAVAPTDDLDNPIMHSALFFLVDQQGQVRGIYDSLDDTAMKQLATDAERLTGSGGQPPMVEVATDESPVHAGGELYASLGCAACHNQTRVAPPVRGLFGNTVTLDDGHQVLANDTYLRESILAPTAAVVVGYLPLMPSYRDHLTDKQVDQLVTYIRSLGSSPTEGQAVALAAAPRPVGQSVVVDPVCKMRVAASDQTLHADYQGKTYYFCSDHCQLLFAKNPAAYAGK